MADAPDVRRSTDSANASDLTDRLTFGGGRGIPSVSYQGYVLLRRADRADAKSDGTANLPRFKFVTLIV